MNKKMTVTSPVVVARYVELEEAVRDLHLALDAGASGGNWEDRVLDALDVLVRIQRRGAIRREETVK